MPSQTPPPYVITVPDEDDSIELQDIVDLVTTIRAALIQAVADAAEAVPAGTATEDYVDAAVAAATPPGSVQLRMVGNRLGQVVDNRPDGTKSVATITYVGDLPTTVQFTNPARTVTYSSAAAQVTGWTVS